MTIKVTKSDLTQMRVYADTFKHPKMLKVSGDARWTAFELWSYCHRYRTDGHLPAGKVAEINPDHLAELLDAGLIDVKGGDYWMHDYTDHQPSRAQMEAFETAQAESARKRSRAGQAAAGARWGKAGAK